MVVADSLYTLIYNHLLDRVAALSVRELDFGIDDRAHLHGSATQTPGAIEIGPGTAVFEDSERRTRGKPRDFSEWGWLVSFKFDKVVDAHSVMTQLAEDSLVPADAELGTGPFRVSLISVTPKEPPRQSEEHGSSFEVEYSLELQRI